MYNASTKINGKRWAVVFDDTAKGSWGDSDANTRRITISPCMNDETTLDVIIHEMLHASCDFLAESVVEQTATDICNFLWAQGWRPPKNTKA